VTFRTLPFRLRRSSSASAGVSFASQSRTASHPPAKKRRLALSSGFLTIDRAGAPVDVMLSETRDMAAAEKFLRSAKAVTGVTPARVTTDGHDSYPRAIRSQLGADVRHRSSQYLNNRIGQDHRGIKSRYGPMRGFGAVNSAARFC
jgi:transposase-like protein